MNIGSPSVPVWALIGEGFTEFAERKHAVCSNRRYIHEASKRTDVTGYAPEIDYELEVIAGDPVIARIRAITDGEHTGEDAKVQLLTVDLFDETDTDGVYNAVSRTYAVIPDRCAEGTDTLCYTGAMRASGEPIHGTFVLSTGVFA